MSYQYIDGSHPDAVRPRPGGVLPYDPNDTEIPLYADSKKGQNPRRKRTWLWIGLVLLVLLLAGGLTALLLTRNSKNKKSTKAPNNDKNSTVDPFNLGGFLSPTWDENLTAYGMFSSKRCEMLGPKLCGELKYLTVSVPAMRKELLSFWKTHGPDAQYGGFHGTLDRTGVPVSSPEYRTDKGVVQQARHLWSFSAYHELYTEEEGVKSTLKPVADNLYKFLMSHMLDKSTNLFVFKVRRNGTMYPMKEFNVYANFFAILGLARYAEAFQVQAAAQQALRTFQALDKRTWDTVNQGYSQLMDVPVLENGTNGKPIPKGQNVHLHALEALTRLFKTTKNEMVKERLIQLVQVTTTKIFRESPPKYYYALKYFDAKWSPVLATGDSKQMVNHGHNLQFCWTLLDAIDTLGSSLPSEAAKLTRKVALGGGEYSIKMASQEGAKGVCTESAVDEECAGTPRVWWVQAESLLALWKMYHLTGKVVYLKRLGETLTWVSNNQTDISEFKEQFAILDAGTTSTDIVTRLMMFDGMKDAKGSFWKASYHSLRSLMFLEVWMKQVAKNDDSVNSATVDQSNTPASG